MIQLSAGASSATGAGLPDQPANNLGFDLPIVDAHHHFWRLSAGHYPWLSDRYDPTFFLGDYRELCSDFLLNAYSKATSGFRIVSSVHVEAERSRNEQVAETAFLTDLHHQTGRPDAIIGHVYFVQPDCADILARQAEFALVRGIRSKPKTAPTPADRVNGEPGSMQDEHWLAGYALLERHGLSWDLRVPYWELEAAAKVARAFPAIPVAINHLGLPTDRSGDALAVWRRGMLALAACSNVVVKVSQFGLANGRWDSRSNIQVIREAIDVFGFERAMFGSNLPVAGLAGSFRDGIADILTAVPDATSSQLNRLFSGTATAFYRLQQAEEEQERPCNR